MGNDASKGASGDEAVGAAPSSQVEIDEALLESCWSRLQALNKSMNMDQDQVRAYMSIEAERVGGCTPPLTSPRNLGTEQRLPPTTLLIPSSMHRLNAATHHPVLPPHLPSPNLSPALHTHPNSFPLSLQYEDLNDAIIRVSGGDGTITEVQFVEACTEVLTPESEGGPSLVLLKCMFETYDRSNQGNITVEEVRYATFPYARLHVTLTCPVPPPPPPRAAHGWLLCDVWAQRH